MPCVFLACGILRDLLFDPASPDGVTSKGTGVKLRVGWPSLPIAAGLGSSAAYSVAAAGSMILLRKRIYDLENASKSKELEWREATESETGGINDWAFCAEALFHGQPSGLDNTVSSHGGAIAFSRSPHRIRALPPLPLLDILVVNTKVPKNTGLLVSGVQRRHDVIPEVVRPVFTAIDAISRTCVDLVKAEHRRRMRVAVRNRL